MADTPARDRSTNDSAPSPEGLPSGSETQPDDERDIAKERSGSDQAARPSTNVPIDPNAAETGSTEPGGQVRSAR